MYAALFKCTMYKNAVYNSSNIAFCFARQKLVKVKVSEWVTDAYAGELNSR